MKILELFCGTKSFSKVAQSYSFTTKTLTLDIEKRFNPDICIDILDYEPNEYFDIVWASPPCQCFSVATIGRNWNKDYTPKTEQAKKALLLVNKTLDVIKKVNPRYYFIENPVGMLRKMPQMAVLNRNTVTYCQYGDTRMKPTDIWTNLREWKPKPMCKNGDSCHQSAPRGSKTGTQGLKNAEERGIVPPELCKEILLTILKNQLGL